MTKPTICDGAACEHWSRITPHSNAGSNVLTKWMKLRNASPLDCSQCAREGVCVNHNHTSGLFMALIIMVPEHVWLNYKPTLGLTTT